MDILAGLPGLLAALKEAGPIGTVVGTILVVLFLVLVLSSKVREMLAGTKAIEQSAAFQAAMIDVVRMMRDDEVKLRAKIDQLEAENHGLADDVLELRTMLALIRNQRRRLLRLLREGIAAGRIPAAALDPVDAVVRT